VSYTKRLLSLTCATLLAAGCRDAVQPSASHPGGDPGRPLALATGSSAPVLNFSTYLGGSGDDDAASITVDANGYTYVTGQSASIDFPATAGAFRVTNAGLNDVVVTKLDPAGSALVYSTYFGGISDDEGEGLAIDAAGNAYVSGHTYSKDFATTAGAFRATWPAQGGNAFVAFVAKLNPTGSGLVYSTYLGGAGGDDAGAIAVDGGGNAYVTGVASSSNFPVTVGAFQTAIRGQEDAFVAKLNASGSALVYSTYLGGGSTEHGSAIAIDADGYAYVAGRTTSGDFPTTPGAFQTTKSSGSTSHAAFVTKLNPSGSALAYSTYLAGSGSDLARAIALDGFGNAYVAGRVGSSNFPTTAGAFQTTLAGGKDAFVAKLDPGGAALTYSTYLGGALDEEASGIAVGADGSVYVAGKTKSTNFPTTAGAIQPAADSLAEGFVAKLDASGSTLAYSSYLGGTGADEITGLALDANGSVYVSGTTGSLDFPTTAGAFDSTLNAPDDFFVAKLADFGPAATLALTPAAANDGVNTPHCVTAGLHDAATNAVPGVTVRFSVSGAHSTGGSAQTDASGQAAFCYTGTQAGEDTVTAVGDTNGNGVQDPGEPSNTATTTWVVVGPPAALTLAPAADSSAVNTQHCVTATVQDAAMAPVPGVTVRFAVTGAHSAGGSGQTDASGQAAFCYSGTQVGDDTITAFADTNDSGVQDTDEPSNTATKRWVVM
jgi:Bacterial Ig-like domain (group 1)/Beta-propeller repeat